MSASVFKPIALEYARKSLSDRRTSTKGLAKVKRVLFEPVDHAETRNFLMRELKNQSIAESQKWNFDFAKGKPFSPKADARYEWTRVTDATYFMPRRRPVQPEPDISNLYCSSLDDIVRPTPHRPDQKDAMTNESVTENKKQCLMTDFMAVRKRSNESAFAKKADLVRPSKKTRSNNDIAS